MGSKGRFLGLSGPLAVPALMTVEQYLLMSRTLGGPSSKTCRSTSTLSLCKRRSYYPKEDEMKMPGEVS